MTSETISPNNIIPNDSQRYVLSMLEKSNTLLRVESKRKSWETQQLADYHDKKHNIKQAINVVLLRLGLMPNKDSLALLSSSLEYYTPYNQFWIDVVAMFLSHKENAFSGSFFNLANTRLYCLELVVFCPPNKAIIGILIDAMKSDDHEHKNTCDRMTEACAFIDELEAFSMVVNEISIDTLIKQDP